VSILSYVNAEIGDLLLFNQPQLSIGPAMFIVRDDRNLESIVRTILLY